MTLCGERKLPCKFGAHPPRCSNRNAFRLLRPSGMIPVVALEPLKNGVLVLAGAVILLALFLLVQRSIAALVAARVGRREPKLSRLVYRAVPRSPVDSKDFRRLSRLDRKLVRSILLGLALDLRGDTGEAI